MYVVSVEFQIEESSVGAFKELMVANARTTLESEPGCRQFDVSTSHRRPGVVFVYELYDDRECLKTHAASAHYQRFDEASKAMVLNRTISTWERLFP